MIGLGSFSCNTISLGNLQVSEVWLGNMQVWAATHSIVLDDTSSTVRSSEGTYSVFLTASTNSWTAITDSNWISLTKTSSTRLTYIVDGSTSTSNRSGHIFFQIDGTTYATFTVTQYAGYVFNMLSSDITLSSAATYVDVYVQSIFQNNPYSAITYSIGSNTMGLAFSSATDNGNTGQYDYRFTLNQNTTYSAKTAAISFTQSGSNATVSINITQKAKVTSTDISGVTTYATNGDWILGYVNTGTHTATSVQTKGIVLVYPDEITEEHTATLSMVYQTGPFVSGTSPTLYTLTDEEYTVSAGQTINVSLDGETYTFNGRWITYPTPGTQINYLSRFDIT